MTVTELLESVRRIEVRTNRLVNDTMGGAYLSGFKGRGMDCTRFNSLEFEGFRIGTLSGGGVNPVEIDGIRIGNRQHIEQLKP